MKRYSIKEQKTYLSEWRESGLSINQFCRENDLKATTFHTWKKRLPQVEQKLVEVPIREISESNVSSLQLHKGSYSIKLTKDFDEDLLKRVLLLLEQLHD